MNNPLPAALCTLLLLCGCGPPPIPPAPAGPAAVQLPPNYEWITPAQAAQLIATHPDLKIADVRTEDEFHRGAGRIAGALLAPYLDGNQRYLDQWDKDKPWLVYCALGARSELTAADMAKMGFKKVYLLKGGFNAWLAEGRPVEK